MRNLQREIYREKFTEKFGVRNLQREIYIEKFREQFTERNFEREIYREKNHYQELDGKLINTVSLAKDVLNNTENACRTFLVKYVLVSL